MLLSRELTLLRSRLVINTTRTTRVSNVIVIDHSVVVNDRLVDIRVVDDRTVHVHNRRVVSEVTSAPFSTGKADTHVAKAVVHAAVESNVIAPIAVMKEIVAAFPSPVRGSPERTRVRRRYPRTRHPVITIWTVSPVARRPHQTLFRTWRLYVNWKYRRSNTDTDKHAGK
jgi:hypothetical protein